MLLQDGEVFSTSGKRGIYILNWFPLITLSGKLTYDSNFCHIQETVINSLRNIFGFRMVFSLLPKKSSVAVKPKSKLI